MRSRDTRRDDPRPIRERERSTLRRGLAAGLGTAFLCVATQASALEENPAVIEKTLGTPCTPPCTICHASLSGGIETLYSNGFWLSLAAHEWDLTNAGLADALLRLESAGVDSDGDGIGDVAELRSGRNPQLPGDELLCAGLELPAYGCGAEIAPRREREDAPRRAFGAAALSALCLSVWLVRRRSLARR